MTSRAGTGATGSGEERDGPRRRIEVELKYLPRTLEAGERVLVFDRLGSLVAADEDRAVAYEDRYVDTPTGAVAAGGLAARIRTTEGGTIISLKSTARATHLDAARHEREEVEGPADPWRSPRDWPPSQARSLILELAAGAELRDVVTLRQRRRRRRYGDGSTTVELSLDEVEVVAGDQVLDRWTELEAELVEGDAERLTEIATILGRNQELAPARASKLERAIEAVERRRTNASTG